MAKGESKVQKVARKAGGQNSNGVGTCQCGGIVVWAKFMGKNALMVKVCEKCGYGA
jgi:hypothetical protein